MAKVKLQKGKHVVETSLPREVVALKSQGYKVVDAVKPAPKTDVKK